MTESPAVQKLCDRRRRRVQPRDRITVRQIPNQVRPRHSGRIRTRAGTSSQQQSKEKTRNVKKFHSGRSLPRSDRRSNDESIFQALAKALEKLPMLGNFVWQPLCERLSNQWLITNRIRVNVTAQAQQMRITLRHQKSRRKEHRLLPSLFQSSSRRSCILGRM